MWMLAWVLAICALTLLGVLLAWSPGRPQPFVDKDGKPLAGSISEKVFLEIGGLRQGMFIKSKDQNNPVLLYLHGGLPDYFLTQRHPTGLEEYFTVVWWEQRGSGLSYRPDIPQQTLTVEQFIADTLEVTNYLRRRFGKEKIYLMGHSGGTFTGIQAASQAPHLYQAYIGVAQMSDQLKSEQLAHSYMLAQFKERGDTRMVGRLEAAPVTISGGTPRAYLALRDGAMHSLGIGTTHTMKSVLSGIFLPSLQFPEYSLMEKINFWRAKARSGVSALWLDILATDLSQQLIRLDLPVYFFHGRYDYTVSYRLAQQYFAKIQAPTKGFYTFEHSAYSPNFEEPQRMLKILREDVLLGRNSLADMDGKPLATSSR